MAGPMRVLLVADNSAVADEAAARLRSAGHEVRVCSDGPSALVAAAEFSPDVCAVDPAVPGIGGEDFADWLSEQAGGRRVAIVTLTAGTAASIPLASVRADPGHHPDPRGPLRSLPLPRRYGW